MTRSPYKEEFFRLLNYINARVFLGCYSELSGTSLLYTPRIYMTEDDCFDITMTTLIPYDFWEVAPAETMDYITAYCPELLDKLAPVIFGVLLGEISISNAIKYLEDEVIK